LIRGLSSVEGGDNYSRGGLTAPLEIQLVPGKSYIYLKYFRLAAAREIPSIQRCHVWKPMISLAPAMPSAADEDHIEAMDGGAQALLVFKGKQQTYFPAIGRDFQTVEDGLRVREVAASDDVYEVTFENIAYPMPPAALMFCAQQDSEGYSNLASTTVSRCVQNRDCNMSIEAIELTVNTSDKVLHYSADTTNQLDRRRLFESTSKNCGSATQRFFKGDINAWQDRNCVVYLASDEWLPLSVSPGMLAPITISAKVRFKNRNVYMDGVNEIVDAGLSMAAIRMRSQPVMIAFYNRPVATVAPASMTLGIGGGMVMHSGQEVLAGNR
jgi:hypothetical protein